MSYSKDDVKEQLELEDIYNLFEYFEAEPQLYNTYIIAKTICHDGNTHKLYYYENTGLCKCYSGHCGTFDIFELIQKIENVDLNKAIYFVVNFFNLQSKLRETDEDFSIEDWKIFNHYKKIDDIEIKNNDKIYLPQISDYIKHYPQPRLLNWEKEGISYEVCKYMNIHYNPVNGSILIPHYDENNRLIGIRQRTLVQEDEIYGKYRPTRLQGQLCNHPLAFNLYGLNIAKENIRNLRTAIVVESEKSVLEYITYFGIKADICVAVCGSSLSNYQFNLLLEAGAQEIVIAFDRDYKEYADDDYFEVEKKLLKLYNKYATKVNMSFLIDKEHIINFKNSPLDCGKEAFLYLFRNRIVI